MFINTKDGVRLHVEEAGQGSPILFVHEFGGNHASWEPQLRFFSRRHRCITYAARGYPPSDVPPNVAAYSQQTAADDAIAVLDALDIDKAHIVGLSMGGFATLHVGLRGPDRARSLTVAGAGYGCEKELEDYFRKVSLEVADRFEQQGAAAFAKIYAVGAGRNSPIAWRPIPLWAPR
jgi:pimeloyl-ACP methyl ester carboxylesterase